MQCKLGLIFGWVRNTAHGPKAIWHVYWNRKHLILTLYWRSEPHPGYCSHSSSESREGESKLCDPLSNEKQNKTKQWLRDGRKLLWDHGQTQSNFKIRVEPWSAPNKQLLNLSDLFQPDYLYVIYKILKQNACQELYWRFTNNHPTQTATLQRGHYWYHNLTGEDIESWK